MLPNDASVTSEGSILLAKNVVCDGYASNRKVGVVTHFHSDHTHQLPNALRYCNSVLVTHACRELLILTQGENLPPHLNKLKNLPYAYKEKFDSERITLLPAKHVLGAAQVLVETEDNQRLLYSGDFLIPGTLPPEVDLLVTEETYGSPYTSRLYSREIVLNRLATLIRRLLRRGPVSLISYQGKLREVMNRLFEQEIDAPFLAPPHIYDVAQVYRQYGIEVGDCIMLETKEAQEAEKDPHIVFLTRNQNMPRASTRIYISGRCPVPYHKLNNHCYIVGLSTHADFNGLLWYIGKSKAKSVIVDGARHPRASLFSHLIEKKLGINCVVTPG